MKKTINGLGELEKFTKDFLKEIKNEKGFQKDSATLVWLEGDLGAGKTTFVQNIGKHLNIKETVNSPTFVISKRYKISGNKDYKNLIHIDAYRLSTKNDLENIGFFKDIENPDNLIFMEWGSLVSKYLPEDLIKATLKYINEDNREVRVDF